MIELVYYTAFPQTVVPEDLILVGRGGTRGDITVFIKTEDIKRIKNIAVTDSYGLPSVVLDLGSVKSKSPEGYYAVNTHPSKWNEYVDEGVEYKPEYKTQDELCEIVAQGEQEPGYILHKMALLDRLHDRLMT